MDDDNLVDTKNCDDCQDTTEERKGTPAEEECGGELMNSIR